MVPLILLGLVALAALGWGAWERRRAGQLQIALASAEAREAMRGDMGEILKAQAAQSANAVAEEMVKRAAESFRNQELLAQQRLEAQLKPVAEGLAKFEALEKARAEETGGLKQQITHLMQATVDTQTEARKLSSALRRGAGVQGRWGEQTLRNVLEMAGLQNRFDFDEQASTDTEEGRRRPDVVVKMPGGSVLIIDAKCSLNAFLEAQEAVEDAARDAAYVRHGESVRAHAKGLSQKAYQTQFDASPDLVAMFVPGDGFLAAALERQPDLLNEAMRQKVVIVTPTTLFALCKAVAYGWRMEESAKSAKDIAEAGKILHKRLSAMGSHVLGLGKSLENAVGKYNAFVGSLESQVLTQARRFEEFAADHEGAALEEPRPIETGVRPLAKLVDASEAATLEQAPESLTKRRAALTSG